MHISDSGLFQLCSEISAGALQLTSKWNISCFETLGHKMLPLVCLLAHHAALARSMDSGIRLNVLFGFQENYFSSDYWNSQIPSYEHYPPHLELKRPRTVFVFRPTRITLTVRT